MRYTLCSFVYFAGGTLKPCRNITVPCGVKPGVMVALDSCSSLRAFYLYVCDYDFVTGIFPNLVLSLHLFIHGTFSRLAVFWESDSLCSCKDYIGVCGGLASQGYSLAICPAVQARNLRVTLSSFLFLATPSPPLMAQQVSLGWVISSDLTLACEYFLNQHPPLHPFCHPPLFWSFLLSLGPGFLLASLLPAWFCSHWLYIFLSLPYLIPSALLRHAA